MSSFFFFYLLCNGVTRLEGNPVCSKIKDTYCSNKKNTKSTMVIAVIVPVVMVSLLAVMCTLWALRWKGKAKFSALKLSFINGIGGRH